MVWIMESSPLIPCLFLTTTVLAHPLAQIFPAKKKKKYRSRHRAQQPIFWPARSFLVMCYFPPTVQYILSGVPRSTQLNKTKASRPGDSVKAVPREEMFSFDSVKCRARAGSVLGENATFVVLDMEIGKGVRGMVFLGVSNINTTQDESDLSRHELFYFFFSLSPGTS